MAGCYLSWLGAFIMANQAAKSGKGSVGGTLGMVAVLTVACGAVAAVTGFPGAGWNVPTFAIAVLPALALGTWASSLGATRG
jgi:hypothetical protein